MFYDTNVIVTAYLKSVGHLNDAESVCQVRKCFYLN